MTIREVMNIVDGKVLVGEDRLDAPVDTACGSDLMSDVLAFVKEKTVLITGLINPLTTYTACGELYLHGLPGTKPKKPVTEGA